MESSIASRIRRYRNEKSDGSTAELLDRLLTLSGEISTLSAAYDSARRARAEAFDGVDVEGLRTLAEGAQPPPRPASEVDREIQFYSKKIESLTEVERTNERDKAALEAQTPDLSALRGKMTAVENSLKTANRRFAALQLALTVMDEASTYMRSTIAPKLTEYASECFRTATIGKYDRLLLDTRMGMTVETPGAAECGLPLLRYEGQRLPLSAAGAAAAAVRAVRAAADGAGRFVCPAGREAPAGAALCPRPHVRGERHADFPLCLYAPRTAAAGQARRAVHASGLEESIGQSARKAECLHAENRHRRRISMPVFAPVSLYCLHIIIFYYICQL